nr:4487_t:CDS:2 [Entrophospora candida]
MNYYMNENEWLSLKELLELLKKVAEATELLGGCKCPTLSLTYLSQTFGFSFFDDNVNDQDVSELNLYLKIPQISIKENVKNHLSKLIKHIKKISSSSVPC